MQKKASAEDGPGEICNQQSRLERSRETAGIKPSARINRLYRLKMQPTAAERALFILVKKTPRVPVPLKSLYSAAI